MAPPTPTAPHPTSACASPGGAPPAGRPLRRLRRPPSASMPDLRPTLLSIITLMFLLLPFLLLTTSIQKLAGLGLEIARPGAELPALPPGTVEHLEVHVEGTTLRLRVAARTTDVTAMTGDVTWNETPFAPQGPEPDLAGLQEALHRWRALDPERERILVIPADDTPARRVIEVMDAVRSSSSGPLFSEVVLGDSQASAPSTAPDGAAPEDPADPSSTRGAGP